MKKIYLHLPLNITIQINTDETIVFGEREKLLLSAYIPGAILNEKTSTNPNKIIHYKSNNQQGFFIEGKNILIHDNWLKEIPLYFFHLLYGIFHKEILNKNFFSIHSVCVTKHSSSILLVGHSGDGKTIIGTNLLKNFRFKMFSSNKTLVKFEKNNMLSAIAGTTTITSKQDDYSNLTSLVKPNKINFSNRVACELFDNYLKLGKNVQLKRIYLVKLNPVVEKVQKLDTLESIVALFPFFLDYVNSDIILFDGHIFYDSFNKLCKKEKLLISLKKSLHNLEIYTVSGSLSFISEIINKHYE